MTDNNAAMIEQTPKQKLQAAIESLGLMISAQFIPFSLSRNKGEKSPSLNWRVTLQRFAPGKRVEGETPRDVISFDYSAGCAHCPGYKFKFAGQASGRYNAQLRDALVAWECENGNKGFYGEGPGSIYRATPKTPLQPDTVSVIHSIVLDSSVLDYSTYESWGTELGYDPDSRKGEAIYRLCLEHALALRAAIGEAGIEALRVAGQDY